MEGGANGVNGVNVMSIAEKVKGIDKETVQTRLNKMEENLVKEVIWKKKNAIRDLVQVC